MVGRCKNSRTMKTGEIMILSMIRLE